MFGACPILGRSMRSRASFLKRIVKTQTFLHMVVMFSLPLVQAFCLFTVFCEIIMYASAC